MSTHPTSPAATCGWCLGPHPITACPWGARLVAYVMTALCAPAKRWR